MANRSSALVSLAAVAAVAVSSGWVTGVPSAGDARIGPLTTFRSNGVAFSEATLTSCTGQPDGTVCDDGNACTLGEKCNAQNCLAPLLFTQALGSPHTVGSSPNAIGVGDFNGDFNLDLAVANVGSNPGTLSILLGDGSGGFTGPTSVTVGRGPVCVAVGDWNTDSNLDLAVANSADGTLSILLGDGSGEFAGTPITIGPFLLESIAVGDFNSDGHVDLAVTEDNTIGFVAILLGDGLGGFMRAADVAVGSEPFSVVVGDWNEDGRLDLATGNTGSDNVSILLGDRCGGFSPATGTPPAVTLNATSPVAVGDFNGDGHLDLVLQYYNTGAITMLLGDGAGGFTNFGTPPNPGGGSYTIAVGDLNGDGKLDVATGYGGAVIHTLRGNGLGGFSLGPNVSAGSVPRTVVMGDWNKDGKLDLAIAAINNNNVTIQLNDTSHAANGTPCSDGNPCTQTETCQANVCHSASSVVCVPSDNCHSSACSPTTGQCVEMPAPAPSDVNNSVRVNKAPVNATIAWCFAAPASSSAVLRGPLGLLPVGPADGDECLGVGLPPSSIAFPDATTSVPGAGFWYLVRADNACGEGPYGYQEQHGVPTLARISLTCP
jgi:hypothetical protein